MTIGLANSATKSRNVGTIVNLPQGGGDKKAGLPPQNGLIYWDFIYYRTRGIPKPLNTYQTVVFPLAHISRPIGRNNNIPYWQIR
jgi:hypothetical protein